MNSCLCSTKLILSNQSIYPLYATRHFSLSRFQAIYTTCILQELYQNNTCVLWAATAASKNLAYRIIRYIRITVHYMKEHRHGVFRRHVQQKMLPRKRDMGFSRIVVYPHGHGLKVMRSKASQLCLRQIQKSSLSTNFWRLFGATPWTGVCNSAELCVSGILDRLLVGLALPRLYCAFSLNITLTYLTFNFCLSNYLGVPAIHHLALALACLSSLIPSRSSLQTRIGLASADNREDQLDIVHGDSKTQCGNVCINSYL